MTGACVSASSNVSIMQEVEHTLKTCIPLNSDIRHVLPTEKVPLVLSLDLCM